MPRHQLSWFKVLIAGLLIASCGSEAQTQPAPQDAADTLSLPTDREIAAGKLVGSFRDAGEDRPAILIVPGSGPTDRDGNNPMGVAGSTYRMLADALQAEGLSSLRVDKRGMFGSASAGDPNAVTIDLYVQDYLAWVEVLRAETGRDCVYLLGHSEGGLMVSATAAEENEGICGLILAAAPGRSMGDILREQLRANRSNKPILPDAMKAIESLEGGRAVDVSGMHPALQGLFAPAVQGFLISMMSVDPVEIAGQSGVPILILQGDRDLQVTMEDATALAQVPDTTLVTLPGVNHLLKPSPKGRRGNLATYSDPDLPLADGVAEAIAAFIAEVEER